MQPHRHIKINLYTNSTNNKQVKIHYAKKSGPHDVFTKSISHNLFAKSISHSLKIDLSIYLYIYTIYLYPVCNWRELQEQLRWNLNWILISASAHSGIEDPADHVACVISGCWQWSTLPAQKLDWYFDSSTNREKLSLITSKLGLFSATSGCRSRDRVIIATFSSPGCHIRTQPNIPFRQDQTTTQTSQAMV